MGAWLESYAQILDLNVWTSSTVLRASQDPASKKWTVVVRRADATERVFRVNHLGASLFPEHVSPFSLPVA